MASFLLANGIDIPKGIYSPKTPARFVALADLKKELGMK
jgi:hypothetical protein